MQFECSLTHDLIRQPDFKQLKTNDFKDRLLPRIACHTFDLAPLRSGECVKDRSEPCHIRQVLEVLAAAKGMDENELAEMCYRNTLEVFFPDEYAAAAS